MIFFLYIVGWISLTFGGIGLIDAATRTAGGINVGIFAETASGVYILLGIVALGLAEIIGILYEMRDNVIEDEDLS